MTVVRCDRCRDEIDIAQEKPQISVMQGTTILIVKDLCVNCQQKLYLWFKEEDYTETKS